ncbi:thioredoxin family protein [Haloprofundus halobius]|uniref:thioredoxin family protein n=1 Tax=Haloprofundus halobius TaxID=2876194 RepID=UPI001CCD7A2B|nr:thioredoxin family protein [Haloprofundus halobius]
MELNTMEPNPTWSPAGYEDAVEALGREGLTFKVWGGDWCKDCRQQLPDFAAALREAGVPEERIEQFPVEKNDDGSKRGPRVGEYDIELIPTIVVEKNGEELVRYVEDEPIPATAYLGERLEEVEQTA